MNLALDLDGTLVSCEPRQSAVLQAALVSCGARADLNKVWELKRDGASTEQALVQQGLCPELSRRIAESWRRMIEDPLWLALDSVLPGVMETLQEMRGVGARIWLLTARSRCEWVPQQLARLGLKPLFDQVVVVPAYQVAQAKAAVLREVLPVAFWGDTEADWRASTAAGVPFFSVGWGQRSAAFLIESGAEQVHCDLPGAWEAFLAG